MHESIYIKETAYYVQVLSTTKIGQMYILLIIFVQN